MDAIELLSKQDIRKLLEYYGFENIREEGKMLRCSCKIHGGDNPSSFVVNTDDNLYFCHTGCNKGGDIFTLVMVMEDIGFIDAVKFLSSFYDVDIKGMQIKERSSKLILDVKNFIRVIKNKRRKKLEEYSPVYTRKDVERYRNFSEQTIKDFGMFYVSDIELQLKDKKITVHNKLFFPITWEGRQIGAVLRRTNEKESIKWSNQPISLQTGDLLYNYERTYAKYDVVVVEGILDVWAFHEIGITAVATFGAHLTKEQYYLLLKTGANIVLCYDGDSAGRKATEDAVRHLKKVSDVYIIDMNDGEDAESITREELILRYESRSRV